MQPKQRPDHRGLAERAAHQHGIVSVRQLAALGYSPGAIKHATASGRLHRIHRGVYAVGYVDLNWHARALATVLANAPRALLSHASAGWLWGLLRSRPETIHITAPSRRHAKREARVHHARLAADDRAVRDGIPVTALPRTLLDLAATLPADRLDRAVERSEKLRLFDLGPVEALLSQARGHSGVEPLRRALALYRQEPAFTRSGLERRFLKLARAAGLPPPSMNFNVAGYELDAYWERERFAVELDVYETHGTHAAFERDRLRQEDLKLAGIEMTRVTGPRLDREPKRVVERVAALLEQRRRELQ